MSSSDASDDEEPADGGGNETSSSDESEVTTSNGTELQGVGLVSGMIPAGTPLDSTKHGTIPVERCGSLVNPSIQQEADGLYFVSLYVESHHCPLWTPANLDFPCRALPNVTSTQQFFLRLQDVLGFEFDSAPFFLGQLSTSDSADRESGEPVPVAAVSDPAPGPAATRANTLANGASSMADVLSSSVSSVLPRTPLENLIPRDLGASNSLLPFDRASASVMAISIAVPLILVFLASSTAVYLCLKRRWKLGGSHRPLILTERVSLRGQRESWVAVGGNPYLSTRSRRSAGEMKKQRKEIPKMLASLEDLEDLVHSMSGEMGVSEDAKSVRKPDETHTLPGRMSTSGPSSSRSMSQSEEATAMMQTPALPELIFSAGSSAWSGSKSRSATAESTNGTAGSRPFPPPAMQETKSRSLTDSYFKALMNSGLDEEPSPMTALTSNAATSTGTRPRPSPIPEEYQTQSQLFSSPVQQGEHQAALASSPLLKNAHEMKREKGSGYFGKGARLPVTMDSKDEQEAGNENVAMLGQTQRSVQLAETVGSVSQSRADLVNEGGKDEAREAVVDGYQDALQEDEEEGELAEVTLSPLPPLPSSLALHEPNPGHSDGAVASQAEEECLDVSHHDASGGNRKGKVAEIARALSAKAKDSGVDGKKQAL
jgi:hypothetical protein